MVWLLSQSGKSGSRWVLVVESSLCLLLCRGEQGVVIWTLVKLMRKKEHRNSALSTADIWAFNTKNFNRLVFSLICKETALNLSCELVRLQAQCYS